MHQGHDFTHGMQLFDDAESLGAGVAGFIHDGLRRGESVLVVAKERHWTAIQASLQEHGTDVGEQRDSGALVVENAGETLDQLMRRGRPDEALLEAFVDATFRRLKRGAGLRVYGDMVDVLAGEGNFRGAMQLEELWNALLARESFSLLCGYSAGSFGHPRDAAALEQICRLHSHVRSDPRDVLGSFLVHPHASPPPLLPG